MAEREAEKAAGAGARAVFISYASQDAALANTVVGALERDGVSCWIAPRDVEPGALYADEIVSAINDCRVVVLVLSAHSVASAHVGKELERASSKHRRIIALRTDATALPRAFEYFLSESQWIEVGPGGLAQAATKLAESVRRHLGSASTAAPSTPTVATKRPRGLVLGIAAALVVAIAAAVAWKFWPANPSAATQRSTAAITDRSIAVLPFVNMSSDKEQEYFSDGLSEELLNELAQIKELRVAGRTSSFSFKGKNEDLRVISEKLGVGHILEGSVRKNGNQLRITAQLIQGRDGTHLWSHTYDREMSDIFAVQKEIAQDVAQALSITLDVGAMSRAKGGTTDVEAYEKYLHARTLAYQLGPRELTQAVQLYHEALALDPDFARAWHGLYVAHSTTLIWIPENAAIALKEMAEASAQMVRIAPDAWWTQMMRANELWGQRKWAEAEIAANAGLAAAPASDITALRAYGSFLWAVGRGKEAAVYHGRALQMDPLSLGVSGFQQIALDVVGRQAEAQAEYKRSQDLAGDHAVWDFQQLKRLWYMRASPADIAAQFRVLLEHESLPMALTRIVADTAGNREAALVAIRQAFDDPSNQDATRMGILVNYADHYGDKDLALAALRRSQVDMRYSALVTLWNATETGFRADPRFKQILRDLKLADYYRASGKWPDFCKPVGSDDFECR
jgi:TolB-like protein/tetratricopeptide (TPR) repeat protein